MNGYRENQLRLDAARTMERAYRDQALLVQYQYLEAMKAGTATDGLALRHREALGSWLSAQRATATAREDFLRSSRLEGQRASVAARIARSGARRVPRGGPDVGGSARPGERHVRLHA